MKNKYSCHSANILILSFKERFFHLKAYEYGLILISASATYQFLHDFIINSFPGQSFRYTFSNYIISNILKKTLKEYIFHYEGWALSSNWYMIFNLVHDNITIWFTDCHNKINIIIFCKYMLFLYFLKIPALPDNKQESALTSLLDLGLFYFFTHQCNCNRSAALFSSALSIILDKIHWF